MQKLIGLDTSLLIYFSEFQWSSLLIQIHAFKINGGHGSKRLRNILLIKGHARTTDVNILHVFEKSRFKL